MWKLKFGGEVELLVPVGIDLCQHVEVEAGFDIPCSCGKDGEKMSDWMVHIHKRGSHGIESVLRE